jgi:formamidopyrimidine-DNA glycosylase
MPELPEVETIKRELKAKIVDQPIKDCILLRKDVIGYPEPEKFCKSIKGGKIVDVTRVGKYLILELTSSRRLIFHLRLSGAIILKEPDAEPERFTRVIIRLADYQIFFDEPRVLGRIYAIKGKETPMVLKGLFNLGHEPLSPKFDLDYFTTRLRGRKAFIKALLLDQSICAGIGNIYSDEALFYAGIRPLRRANRLSRREILKLLKALKRVLRIAVANFGTSVSDYKRTDGKNGNFQNLLRVYAREGEPCRKCGTRIVLKKLGNRGTRYCPRCQR